MQPSLRTKQSRLPLVIREAKRLYEANAGGKAALLGGGRQGVHDADMVAGALQPIFHITTAAEWEAARRAGSYTGSTRGRTLAEEGFIHCSFAEQTAGVVALLFSDCTDPLVLLRIDPELVDAEIKVEPPVPGGEVDFPHIYGPIPVAAVVEVSPLTSG